MRIFLVDPCLNPGIDEEGEAPLRLDTHDEAGVINVFPTRPKPPLAFLYFIPLLEAAGFEVSMIEVRELLQTGTLHSDHFYENWIDFVTKLSPAVFAFTTNAQTYPTAINLSRGCKEASPCNVVVHGGPQASAIAEEALYLFSFIDYVVVGEAEDIFVAMLKAVRDGTNLGGIPNVVFRESNKPRQSTTHSSFPDLNDLPLPAFGISRSDKYLEGHGRHHIILETSRGCPHGCRFCSTALSAFREKRASRVVEELRLVASTFPRTAQVSFVSNQLFMTTKQTERFCAEVHEAALQLPWGCFARTDCISAPILKKMEEAGCKFIHYGLESGSPTIQGKILKNLDIKQALQTIQETLEVGLCAIVNFIIGFPEETRETLNETLKVMIQLKRMGARIYPTVMSPHCGTGYHRHYRNQLVFNRYRQPEINFEEDEILIRRYPQIFSYFYYMQPEHLSLAELEQLYFALVDQILTMDIDSVYKLANYFKGDYLRMVQQLYLPEIVT